MPPKRKRVEKESKDNDTMEVDYNKLYCLVAEIEEYHLDQRLNEVLLFPSLKEALTYKLKICKTWTEISDEPLDFDIDSEEFFNELEFEERIEGGEDGVHISIKITEASITKPGENGEIFRIGDDCSEI